MGLRFNPFTGNFDFTGGSSFDPHSPGPIGDVTPSTGAFTSITATPANDTSGLSITGGSITGSGATSFLNVTGTWNTTGSPDALSVNIVNTASGSSAMMIGLRRSGVIVGGISKTGDLTLRNIDGPIVSFSWFGNDRSGSMQLNGQSVSIEGPWRSISTQTGGIARFTALSASAVSTWFSLQDDEIVGSLSLRDGSTANQFRVANTFSSQTSYEMFSIDWKTEANVARVGPVVGSGGGTARTAKYYLVANGPFITSGSGDPEGVVSAPVGSLFTRTDGGVLTTLYVKQSGAGNTGWAAK